MRGRTETIRGHAHANWPERLSMVIGRNATPERLAAAQHKHLETLTYPADRSVAYRCVGVRIDSARRLIADLVRAQDG